MKCGSILVLEKLYDSFRCMNWCMFLVQINVLPCPFSIVSLAVTLCPVFRVRVKSLLPETWNSYPVATQAFLNLHEVTDEIDEATLCVLERFVIIMYDRTSEYTDLDTVCKHLFTKNSRVLELLPDAFIQHVKHTVHQAVHCWGQCLQKQPQEHNPSDWGWIRDTDGWAPLWMTILEVSQVCSELIHCKCKKGCKSNCKCVKAKLSCTALPHCDGECSRH